MGAGTKSKFGSMIDELENTQICKDLASINEGELDYHADVCTTM
jgi:hypothetical protein